MSDGTRAASGNSSFCIPVLQKSSIQPKKTCGSVVLQSDACQLAGDWFGAFALVLLAVLRDLIRVWFQTRTEIIAENLFLRQLALYLESPPKKANTDREICAGRLKLVLPVAQAWRLVRPSTFVRWHRVEFRLFWRWKSRTVGRPPQL